jgi:hypothetical protein
MKSMQLLINYDAVSWDSAIDLQFSSIISVIGDYIYEIFSFKTNSAIFNYLLILSFICWNCSNN